MRRIKGEYYTQEDQYTSQDGQIPNVRVYNRIYLSTHKPVCGNDLVGFFSVLNPDVAEILMLILKLGDRAGDEEIVSC